MVLENKSYYQWDTSSQQPGEGSDIIIIMLLWFVTIYERNLKKLQFTTQRFDTPV